MVKSNSKQTTDTVLMVSPDSFSFNNETAGSNSFQNKFDGDEKLLNEKVINEFNNMVKLLRDNDVNVIVLHHKDESLPDAVFPNNWFSTDDNGNIIIYPLLTENRRKEKDTTLLKNKFAENSFAFSEITDLSKYEKQNLILEGTGSLILDKEHNAVFAIESERTNKKMFEIYCDIQKIPNENRVYFHANDESGNPIYHTNVIMSIGRGFAVICDECISKDEKDYVMNRLRELGLKVITINYKQLNSFCGNILNIHSAKGESLIVMSESAYKNFDPAQITELEKFGRVIYSDISTIEAVGGGSARCMMAEVFLPKQKNN